MTDDGEHYSHPHQSVARGRSSSASSGSFTPSILWLPLVVLVIAGGGMLAYLKRDNLAWYGLKQRIWNHYSVHLKQTVANKDDRLGFALEESNNSSDHTRTCTVRIISVNGLIVVRNNYCGEYALSNGSLKLSRFTGFVEREGRRGPEIEFRPRHINGKPSISEPGGAIEIAEWIGGEEKNIYVLHRLLDRKIQVRYRKPQDEGNVERPYDTTDDLSGGTDFIWEVVATMLEP